MLLFVAAAKASEGNANIKLLYRSRRWRRGIKKVLCDTPLALHTSDNQNVALFPSDRQLNLTIFYSQLCHPRPLQVYYQLTLSALLMYWLMGNCHPERLHCSRISALVMCGHLTMGNNQECWTDSGSGGEVSGQISGYLTCLVWHSDGDQESSINNDESSVYFSPTSTYMNWGHVVALSTTAPQWTYQLLKLNVWNHTYSTDCVKRMLFLHCGHNMVIYRMFRTNT